MTTAHGLRIACMGGIYDAEIYNTSDAAPVRPNLLQLVNHFWRLETGICFSLLFKSYERTFTCKYSFYDIFKQRLSFSCRYSIDVDLFTGSWYLTQQCMAFSHHEFLDVPDPTKRSVVSSCTTSWWCRSTDTAAVSFCYGRSRSTHLLGTWTLYLGWRWSSCNTVRIPGRLWRWSTINWQETESAFSNHYITRRHWSPLLY